ncbi:Zona pellucida-like domain containing protein 12 [Dinothrombium tinctorium]|uniref:Zona pellucida-like domain containing protein 12 n=1 Tax=Dinothrombium tinctorium TaxID=1965070 RepID=A0A3S3PEZ2_9ACAR|nr:Zona pellucida-like domain containing protein 12 [Dinothrombium tinctorium]
MPSLFYAANISTKTPPVKVPLSSPIADSIQAAGSENRLRWIDYRNRPAYPPRVPASHGIPSGFRNPGNHHQHVNLLPHVHHPPGFGGSSVNPVGFGGSVPNSESPYFGGIPSRRPFVNFTKIEHIAAECSDDYMKVVTHFNGTFTGLIYSAGYVHDANCIYVNGTGRSQYEFFIRLNQCGTLGRQEMYHPQRPGEVRRRDQVMWNTLSIQYNPLIEEEWDEHYRVTCEYGSDFWKTVSFPAVGVEVNTGSPVIFTINPPQCQMEIRRGFGTSGTRTTGPVTVGDPLTLLIHMKSEKAGFDILVKNCIAHNGAQQRLQLIDTNGCVTNEKLISPFRGTYNTNDGHQVTLYAYLKAFRFTGSPALYLECDIHMCHNRCPPQRCYWRNLSKRSIRSVFKATASPPHLLTSDSNSSPLISESLSLFQALEVRHDTDSESELNGEAQKSREHRESNEICFQIDGIVIITLSFIFILIITTTMSICSCIKLRKMKKDQRCASTERCMYKTSFENAAHQMIASRY